MEKAFLVSETHMPLLSSTFRWNGDFYSRVFHEDVRSPHLTPGNQNFCDVVKIRGIPGQKLISPCLKQN